jgi:glycosyltransferase involved in cell wall biosynthesis
MSTPPPSLSASPVPPDATAIATDKPWLTVVIPTFQGEASIAATLASIAAEPCAGIEVLLIDNSPTPATIDIARAYGDRLALRIHERPDLPMWHEKTNAFTALASAPYVCWLHQDDIWLPGRVAAMRGWIAAAPQAALHLAPSAIVDRKGRTRGVWRCPLPAGEVDPALLTRRLLVQNFVAAPAPLIRRECWLACGGLDESLWYTADWDVWLKLAGVGPVWYHDCVTTGFRVHGGSQTMTGSRRAADFTDQMRIVLERHLPRLRGESAGVERAARASIAVNTALAAAAAGDPRHLIRAAAQLAKLGPIGIGRYLRDSRIMDRVAPRVRAKLAGVF